MGDVNRTAPRSDLSRVCKRTRIHAALGMPPLDGIVMSRTAWSCRPAEWSCHSANANTRRHPSLKKMVAKQPLACCVLFVVCSLVACSDNPLNEKEADLDSSFLDDPDLVFSRSLVRTTALCTDPLCASPAAAGGPSLLVAS